MKRLKGREKEIAAFIDELRDSPGKSGRLINGLVEKTNRLYLNFPFIGPARRISSALKKGPFSYFYVFERTLAHKLHPLLYRFGFNIISNSVIDSLYDQKMEYYKPLMPLKAGKVPGKTVDLKMKNLVMMKDLILRMVFKDGHFMVIKYYDNNFSRLDRELSSILKSIELSMHNMKRGLTDDKKSNSEMIGKRFKIFRENRGKENGPLFIERMKWDEELKEYADMLGELKEDRYGENSDSDLRTIDLESGEIPGGGEEMSADEPAGEEDDDAPKDREKKTGINGYADTIKVTYLDTISDEDAHTVKKILETIYTTNREKSGEAKAEEIVTDIVGIWLNDELISGAKKDFLRSVHREMFGKNEGEPDVERRLDAISDFMDNFEKENKEPVPENTLFQNEDELRGGVPHTEDNDEHERSFDVEEPFIEEEQGVEIKDDNVPELGEFPVSGPGEVSEPGEFPVSGPGEVPELGEFSVSGPGEVEEQEKHLLEGRNGSDTGDIREQGEKRLQEIEDRLDKRTRELEEEAGDILNGSDEEKKTAFVIKMLGSETGSQSLFKILPDAESSGGENLFIKIVRKLEEGPFRYMTPSEKAAFIRRLIEVFSADKKLVSQLENYKKLIESPSELLGSVTNNLERIGKENPDTGSAMVKQLKYLEEVLKNEEYEPVWFTVKTLYKNIIKQKKSNVIENVTGDMSGQPQWKQAVILQFLKRFYRGDSRKQDELGKKLAFRELQSLTERIENERKGGTADINEIFKKFTGGSAGISQWAETVIKEQRKKRPAGDDLYDEKEMTQEEKIYNRALELVRSFRDNMDALGPIINALAGLNRGDFQSQLMNEYRSGLKKREVLVNRTVNVIKTGKPDGKLVEVLHKSPPLFQYDWSESVKKKLGAGSLEEAIKPVEKNRDAYSELNRIAMIIKTNNKNDFLKKAVEKEKKLVSDIAGDLSLEGLRKLKSRTVSIRDKEKINLFRDLVKIAGGAVDSTKNQYQAVSEKNAAGEEKSRVHKREESEQKTAAVKVKKDKPEEPEIRNGPGIRDILTEMNNFINLCKSERTRNMAIKSSKRRVTIDSFFQHLASGDKPSVEAAKKNTDELIEVFKGIIKHRFHKAFPTAGPALKYCLDNGLIKRSDLT